jgi:hypothetical protein
MPIDTEKLNEQAKPKRNARNRAHAGNAQQQDKEHLRQQSEGAIATASSNLVASRKRSLKKLDEQLSDFEEDYAEAVVERVNQVPLRIEAKIAEKLQGKRFDDPLESIAGEIEDWEVLEIKLPRLTVVGVAGCLSS